MELHTGLGTGKYSKRTQTKIESSARFKTSATFLHLLLSLLLSHSVLVSFVWPIEGLQLPIFPIPYLDEESDGLPWAVAKGDLWGYFQDNLPL